VTEDRSEAVLSGLGTAYRGARIRPLAGDASTRSFFRLFLPGGGTAVVMDYGAPFDAETDDLVASRIFRDAGLPVARVLDVLPGAGCLVLEDLGDRTLEAEVASLDLPRELDRAEKLYRRAVDLAAAVAVRGTLALRRSPRAAGPALDEARFRFEMDFFLSHYVKGLWGREEESPGLAGALARLAGAAAASPRVFCHRDFHSRNLMVLRDGGLAMVDIQDARWGPDTYDIASLLRDAYVDLDDDLGKLLLEAYRRKLADPVEPEAFRGRFEIVSAQRMIKALGTFGYQIHVLGRTRYADGIPRTLDRLSRILPASPVAAEVGEALARHGLLTPPPVAAPRTPEPD
jgi:aminoglycoside/choline kinase family phosphotransferase